MLRYLVAPAAIVVASVPRYGPLFSAISHELAATCAGRANVLDSLTCNLQGFFGQTVDTRLGVAYMASLFAFIAAALTVTHIESARIFNQGSAIIRHPLWTWLSVNLITGDVTLPCLFAVTLRYQAQQGALGAQGKANRQAGSRLTCAAETIAIPLAVLLGFILPSWCLLSTASLAATVVWNLFPLWVSAIRCIATKLLSRTAFRNDVRIVSITDKVTTLLGLYALPTVLSIGAHIWLLASLDSGGPISPALHVMIINGISCMAMYTYWIFYEASWPGMALAVLCAGAAGPGAGLCMGWVLQDLVGHE